MPVQACQGKITASVNNNIGTYDSFSAVDFVAPLRLKLKNVGKTECKLALSFSSSSLVLKLGKKLPYEILDENGTQLVKLGQLDRAVQNEALNILNENFLPGTSKDVSYLIRIPRGISLPVGTYDDKLLIRVFRTDDKRNIVGAPFEEKEIIISSQIFPKLSVNIAGGNRYGTLQFEELKEGDNKSIFIQTRSNQNYKLLLNSQNNGRLKRTSNLTNETYYVNYKAFLDGELIQFSKNGIALTKKDAISLDGNTRHKLSITIGSTKNKRAGFYKDIVKIKITPVIP